MFLKCIKVLAKGLMHLLFRFEMDDALIDKKGPFIICANHRSNWDAFAMFLASPMDTYIVGKKELSDIPIIGAFLRAIQMIPVDREGNDIAALRTMRKVLKEGHVLGIFPEGHRYDTRDLSHMKDGVAYLVQKAKVPVYCLYLESDYHFRSTFRVTLRDALPSETFVPYDSRAGRKDIMRLIYNSIYALNSGEEMSHDDSRC